MPKEELMRREEQKCVDDSKLEDEHRSGVELRQIADADLTVFNQGASETTDTPNKC